jgi:hypothetical protein
VRATPRDASCATPVAIDGVERQVRRFGALIDHMLDA